MNFEWQKPNEIFIVHGITQARILEWVAYPFSSGSSRPRNQTGVSCITGRFFTNWAIRGAPIQSSHILKLWKIKPRKRVKETFKNKTVWLYTGYLWEEVKNSLDLTNVDVLLDGEFKKELNDNNLQWVGSSNQRIIDVQKSLIEDKVVLHQQTSP